LLIFASFSNTHTDILGIYGGGGVLFGGSYLIVLYSGMILRDSKIYLEKINKYIGFVVFIIATSAWWRFECVNFFAIDAMLPFGRGVNPPSITLTIMALLVFMTIFYFCKILECNSYTNHLITGTSYIGKHTLYIFLYHKLFLDYLLHPYISTNGNIWGIRLLYFMVMIAGSLFIEIIIEKVRLFIKNIYKGTYDTLINL
jgi:hypothetical protein